MDLIQHPESIPEVVVERLQFDFSRVIATRETEHRLAESKAKAEFEREKARKELTWDLWRTAGITVVMVIFIAIALAFTAPLIVNPGTPPESRQLGIVLWTSVITGGLGFLVGKGTRKDE